MLTRNESYSLTTDCPEDYTYQDTSSFDFVGQDQTYYQDQSANPLAISSKKITKEDNKKRASRAKQKGRKEKSYWQPEEDARVLELIQQLGFKWTRIGNIMGGRTGKQVRDRYNQTLNPNISKEKWTAQEDNILLFLYRYIGNKWCQIAELMPGRTENQVKNRFYSKLKSFANAQGAVSSPDIVKKLESDANDFSSLNNLKDLAEAEQTSKLREILDGFIKREDLGFDFKKEESIEKKEEDGYLPEPLEVKQESDSGQVLLSRPRFLSNGGFDDSLTTSDKESETNF